MLCLGTIGESTALTPVRLFNFLVLELGAGTHPKVGTSTLEHNVDRIGLRLVRFRLFQAPGTYSRGVPDGVGLYCPLVTRIRGDLPEFTLNQPHKCIRCPKISKKLKHCFSTISSQYMELLLNAFKSPGNWIYSNAMNV